MQQAPVIFAYILLLAFFWFITGETWIYSQYTFFWYIHSSNYFDISKNKGFTF